MTCKLLFAINEIHYQNKFITIIKALKYKTLDKIPLGTQKRRGQELIYYFYIYNLLLYRSKVKDLIPK